jgi:pyridoxal phosphate enzyme (YggS family)
MAVNISAYQSIHTKLSAQQVALIAVSKTKPNEELMELYALGQRAFGENYVQELVDKAGSLPKDIEWHFIGHLQSNKVKYIAPFVHLIHGVDSEKLLQEINKQAVKQQRVIDCLLQVHIAEEETKFGFDEASLITFLQSGRLADYPNVRIKGLMGMASFSDDHVQVQKEFKQLKKCFDLTQDSMGTACSILSMGMSGDYELAIQEGSNMVRIGSLLFGARNYPSVK